MEGALTVLGRSNPLTLAVTFDGAETDPMDGSTQAGSSATGSLSRRDYAIEFNFPMEAGGFVIGDPVTIELEVRLAAVPAEKVA